MEYIIVLFFLLFCGMMISVNKDRLSRRISLVFYVQWVILLVISLSNPNNLYSVSSWTYFTVCLFLFMLIAGLTFTKGGNKRIINPLDGEKLRASMDSIATSKILLITTLFADIFLGILYAQLQTLLETMSALDYRNEGGVQLLFEGNSVLGVTYTFLVAPLSFFSNFFFCYLLLFNKRSLIAIIIFATNIILFSYTQGQRSGFVDIFIFFAFLLYCCSFLYGNISHKQKVKTIRRDVIMMVLVGVIALGAVSFMTNQRLNNNNELSISSIQEGKDNTSNHLVTYLVGPLRALDYAYNNDYIEKAGGLKYGRSTFGFIDSFLNFVGRNIGIHFKTANGQVYDLLQKKWIRIPSDFNYAYTAIFNFYVDFGFFGILLFPFLLGALIKKLIYNLKVKQNAGILLGIAYMVFVTCTCYFTWRMIEMSAFVVIIWIILLNNLFKKNERAFFLKSN